MSTDRSRATATCHRDKDAAPHDIHVNHRHSKQGASRAMLAALEVSEIRSFRACRRWDNGSTDDTQDVIRRCSASGSRRADNGHGTRAGLSCARNAGVRSARRRAGVY